MKGGELNFVLMIVNRKWAICVLALSLGVACQVSPTSPVNTTNNSNITANSTNTATPTRTEQPGEPTPISPTPTLSPLPPDAAGVQAAIDVVHEYYDAINARDYGKAYELWSGKGEASGQTFEEFRDGFAQTASVEIDTSGEPGDLEGAAGSQYVGIPALIKARMKDGKVENYWAEYVMRRSMVDGATPEQRQWRIYSAKVKRL